MTAPESISFGGFPFILAEDICIVCTHVLSFCAFIIQYRSQGEARRLCSRRKEVVVERQGL